LAVAENPATGCLGNTAARVRGLSATRRQEIADFFARASMTAAAQERQDVHTLLIHFADFP